MKNKIKVCINKYKGGAMGFLLVLALHSCISTKQVRAPRTSLPDNYDGAVVSDTVNSANLNWREFFSDPYLIGLIDTALVNNQELNIMMQQIEIAQSEVKARQRRIPPLCWRAGGRRGRKGRGVHP